MVTKSTVTDRYPVPPCPWAHQAAICPGETAVVDAAGRRLSWQQLDASVRLLSERLHSLPAGPVVHVPGRTPEDIVLLVAAMRSGRDLVLLGPRLPKDQVARIMASIGGVASPGILLADELLLADEYTAPAGRAPLLEGATRLLTSGSTGEARWVRHGARAHLASAQGVTAALQLDAGDCWLWSLPMHHVGGLSILWRCAVSGIPVLCPPTDLPLAAWLFDRAEAPKPTLLSLVPTQLRDLLVTGRSCPPGIRSVVLGGASVAASLVADAASAGWPVRTSYGMTETASMVTLSDVWQTPVPAHLHAGRTLPHADVRIADEQGSAIGPGTKGRIMVHTAALADTGSEEMADHWFATSDGGWMDDEGRLHVAGRLDRVIISGGENIDPIRIEQALMAIPGVQSAVVVGIPHERFGQRPVAFVAGKWTSASGAGLPVGGLSEIGFSEIGFSEAGLRDRLASVLESYAIPDRILPFPSPEAGALKPTLEQLRNHAMAAVGMD